jgi:hypothetical protein
MFQCAKIAREISAARSERHRCLTGQIVALYNTVCTLTQLAAAHRPLECRDHDFGFAELVSYHPSSLANSAGQSVGLLSSKSRVRLPCEALLF